MLDFGIGFAFGLLVVSFVWSHYNDKILRLEAEAEANYARLVAQFSKLGGK